MAEERRAAAAVEAEAVEGVADVAGAADDVARAVGVASGIAFESADAR